MNQYRNLEFSLETHAYQRYCERVERIAYCDLSDHCKKQLELQAYTYNKDGLIHLDGVWWQYLINENYILFITCFGKTTANLPAGLKWAIQHNDRINLATFSGIGVLPP